MFLPEWLVLSILILAALVVAFFGYVGAVGGSRAYAMQGTSGGLYFAALLTLLGLGLAFLAGMVA